MPLHLLGKKSWNVYNHDNIERVRRDEARAQAEEDAADQALLQEDAAERMRILRGEPSNSQPSIQGTRAEEQDRPKDDQSKELRQHMRKRRRLHGEDDTDRDIRFAHEDLHSGTGKAAQADPLRALTRTKAEAPVVDQRGNIDLFPGVRTTQNLGRKNSKNEDAERERKKKEREYEDQYTIRFSNAAGLKKNMGERAWYETLNPATATTNEPEELHGKDVWGNEDPGRRERSHARMAADDPLAAMRRGVEGVRRVERERKQWRSEKKQEIEELDREERGKRRKEKRRRRPDGLQKNDDGIEPLSLDGTRQEEKRRAHRHRHRSHHR